MYQKVLSRYPGYKNTNLTAAVEKICFEGNIDCINLFDPFQTNNAEGLFFNGINFHWNDIRAGGCCKRDGVLSIEEYIIQIKKALQKKTNANSPA